MHGLPHKPTTIVAIEIPTQTYRSAEEPEALGLLLALLSLMRAGVHVCVCVCVCARPSGSRK